MPDLQILEPKIDPNNRITFLLDWEITQKCNMDCTYCPTGLYGGHDNTTKHPSYADCIKSVDFMFEYVDIYMAHRPKGLKYVVLNVYGGESLHHPRIVDILKYARDRHTGYQDRWHLTITTTTNAIVNDKKMSSIIPLIDEFTCSFHSEASPKQVEQFKSNLLTIKSSGKRMKCVIVMHNNGPLFDKSKDMVAWCSAHDIRYFPRVLDNTSEDGRWRYNKDQIIWFDGFYKQKKVLSQDSEAANQVRACCGGRQVCQDKQYRESTSFVSNRFPDWHCSVNHFFLFIKQINGEIFVNKDCKMGFNGSVSPIGNLNDTRPLIDFTRHNLSQNTMPVIKCKKTRCLCGLCAPKAKNLDDYVSIMEKYHR